MGSTGIAAAELSKLVGQAADAAKEAQGGDAAARARCCDVLKVLEESKVTAGVLKETEAGKRMSKLCKSSDSRVAAAASCVVDAWKAAVQRVPSVNSLPNLAELATAEQQQKGASPLRPRPPSAKQQARPASAGANGSKSSSSVKPAPRQPPKEPPKTGDAKRDKIRGLLLVGLDMVPMQDRNGKDVSLVAADVETAIYDKSGKTTGPEYAAKVRSITFNLKDPRNPDLRRRVAAGDVEPEVLVGMSPEDMASDEMRLANNKIRQEVAADLVRGQQQAASTDMFTCGRCKQRKCTYYQLQTRSADEPMTTFVTCVNCNNKWKFC